MSERFEIRELGGREVTVQLTDRALPFRPFTLDGVQIIAEDRALGSPYTHQQPTGAKEEATDLTGEWNDIYLADGGLTVNAATSEVIDGAEVIVVDSSSVRTAREAAEALDDLRKRAAVVRVSWAHVVRVGRIRRFAQKWNTPTDMEWEMTLAWIGQDEETSVAPPENLDPTSDVRALTDGVNQVLEVTNYPIETIEPTVLEVLDSRIAELQTGILDLSDSIRTRVDGATTSVEVFRRGLSILAFTAQEAELLALEIDSRVSGTWIANADPEDLTDLKPGEVLAVLTCNRRGARAARAVRQLAVRRRFDHLTSMEEVAAIYIAREGDDLQSIALFHYGSADSADILRDYNQFTSYTLEPGTVVLAPYRRSAA